MHAAPVQTVRDRTLARFATSRATLLDPFRVVVPTVKDRVDALDLIERILQSGS